MMYEHIDIESAKARLLSLPCRPCTEQVSIYSALGRVPAEDIRSAFPVPLFRKSPFDGYAVRSTDCPGVLHVTETAAAGCTQPHRLEAGCALRIFTGAPLPEGADAVIKQEYVSRNDAAIRVDFPILPETNVILPGEDYPSGALLARAGERLSPALIGVLASQGFSHLSVYAPPVVSLISTGSELTEPGDVRREYSIYNSSAAAIIAFLQNVGLETRYLGIVPDDKPRIIQSVSSALLTSDIVITTGGSSVGDYDFALDAAEAVGAEFLFSKVDMKPGGAMIASSVNGKLLLNLSGNPAAAMMGLILVALPYLKKLCGQRNTESEHIRLPLKYPLNKTSGTTRLLRGHLEITDGSALFVEHEGRGNGNLASFDKCELIGIIPPSDSFLPSGTVIDAVWLK